MTCWLLSVSFALLLFWAGESADAQNSDKRFDFGDVSIENIGAVSDNTRLIALNFALRKGWKIYWHSGGRSSLPPSIQWDAASQKRILSTEILWPYPKTLNILGIETLGYQGKTTLPVVLTLHDSQEQSPQESASDVLSGTLHYPVCKRVCIPAQKTFRIALSPENPPSDKTANRIAKLLKSAPMQLEAIAADLFWRRHNDTIIIQGTVVAENLHNVILSTQQQYLIMTLKKHNDRLNLFGEKALVLKDIDDDAPLTMQLTAKRGTHTVTAQVTIAADTENFLTPQPVRASLQNADFTVKFGWSLAGLALLAGFLLNFMPCVLPVLSLKLLPTASAEKKNLRQDSFFSAIGIVLGFMMLAVLLWILQQSGFVGWGFQFQSPFFLGMMVWAMLLFLSVSLDWLPLKLPEFFPASDFSQRPFMQKITTGIVIVWLASACTAPIISTIVIAALASSVWMMFVMLSLLGVGMAAPYLLIAAFPASGKYLPKTGRWNLVLKYAVTIGLGATALWFLWLLSFHFAARWQVFVIAALAVSLPFGTWLKTQNRLIPSKFPVFLLGGLLMSGWIAVTDARMADNFQNSASPHVTPQRQESAVGFGDFMPKTVPSLLRAQKTVIIDVTARWCITCKINELNVWSSDWGKNLQQNPDIVFMRGDWTLPDETIASFLQKYQHYAIPFTIIFTPQNPQGMILPELFGVSDVKNAIML